MANFKQIEEARRLLGLEEDASLEEIKKAYRILAYKYHPDKCSGKKKKECEEKFKKISHANDVLMSYCSGYRYSFKEKDVRKNVMDREFRRHLKRFYEGWLGEMDL